MSIREKLKRKKFFPSWEDMRHRSKCWAEARARHWANVEHRTFESSRERALGAKRIPQWIVNMILGRYEERGDRSSQDEHRNRSEED